MTYHPLSPTINYSQVIWKGTFTYSRSENDDMISEERKRDMDIIDNINQQVKDMASSYDVIYLDTTAAVTIVARHIDLRNQNEFNRVEEGSTHR